MGWGPLSRVGLGLSDFAISLDHPKRSGPFISDRSFWINSVYIFSLCTDPRQIYNEQRGYVPCERTKFVPKEKIRILLSLFSWSNVQRRVPLDPLLRSKQQTRKLSNSRMPLRVSTKFNRPFDIYYRRRQNLVGSSFMLHYAIVILTVGFLAICWALAWIKKVGAAESASKFIQHGEGNMQCIPCSA